MWLAISIGSAGGAAGGVSRTGEFRTVALALVSNQG